MMKFLAVPDTNILTVNIQGTKIKITVVINLKWHNLRCLVGRPHATFLWPPKAIFPGWSSRSRQRELAGYTVDGDYWITRSFMIFTGRGFSRETCRKMAVQGRGAGHYIVCRTEWTGEARFGLRDQWRGAVDMVMCPAILTFWHRNYFFLILAHPVYKMWIKQEPNMLELRYKLHFEEKKTESIYHV